MSISLLKLYLENRAQVDWGHFGTIVENGARHKLYAFVFTLCWSRVSYVEFIIRGDMATFISCMNRAFEYIGGVPREVLFDNAKVVVSERVGKIVRFNQNLLQFALSSGFTPLACWTNDPESKGKVESQVGDCQGSCRFFSFETLRISSVGFRATWLILVQSLVPLDQRSGLNCLAAL